MGTRQLLLDFINVKKECKEVIKTPLQKDIGNSKSGYLKIEKVSKNFGYLMHGEKFEGYTTIFGENLAVYLINPYNYFHTSVIKKIDWKKHIIKTMNSEYSFEFKEIEDLNKVLEEFDNEVKNLRTV